MEENIWEHFGNWWAIGVWVVLYGIFLAFTPFYQKSQRKPASTYLAFILALALEMFGIPLSMYFVGWAFGLSLPEGILWGHTLGQSIGLWGMYLGLLTSFTGAALVVMGWRVIYRRYWKKEAGNGELVTEGVYGYIRHPQYTGFMMITLGLLFEWATIPLLLMWPMLVVVYYRLAKKEEADMEAEFGTSYAVYKLRTGMFLPRFTLNKKAIA